MGYNLIGEIEVHCNNMENGCMWDGTIAALTEHLEECIYPANKMPKWLKEHLNSARKSGRPFSIPEEIPLKEEAQFQVVNDAEIKESKRLQSESEQYGSSQVIEIPEMKLEKQKRRRKTERLPKGNNKKRKRKSQT